MHIVKPLIDLPPDLARKLIELGVAESIEQMVATVEPLRDRIATKGVGSGPDNHS